MSYQGRHMILLLAWALVLCSIMYQVGIIMFTVQWWVTLIAGLLVVDSLYPVEPD